MAKSVNAATTASTAPKFDVALFASTTATRPCLCSCGETTKSRFVSGHDGRLKGLLLKAARGGDESAKASLIALGWDKFLVVRKADVAKAERAKAKAAKVAAKAATPAVEAPVA